MLAGWQVFWRSHRQWMGQWDSVRNEARFWVSGTTLLEKLRGELSATGAVIDGREPLSAEAKRALRTGRPW
jgi:hypothetical protein